MSADEPLEREIRSVLRRMADDPAPDWLVERIGSIPEEGPVAARRSFLSFAGPLVAAAVVVVAVGAALVLGPLGGLPFGGGAATPSPSGGASPSPSASAEVSPSPVGSSPAESPSAVPAPSASAAASAIAPPAGGPVPTGFTAVSVTFASPQLGWVLGDAPCANPPCTSIVRTPDGGRTWVGIPAPRAPLSLASSTLPGVPAGSGVNWLRFADALDGWAYGPDLWATHDGGATWHRLTVPGSDSATVVALEAAAGTVHAVIADDGGFHIASSPVGSDSWRVSSVVLPSGAGPVPTAQLVLSHGGGWVIQVDRAVIDGARLVGGSWEAWTPPCTDVLGPAVLAASSASDLMAACDGGVWGPPADPAAAGEHLYVSHDSGTTFTETGTTLPFESVSGITSSGPSVVLVSAGPIVTGSFDGGRTWATVLTTQTAAAGITDLGFTTATQGVAIVLAPRPAGSTTAPATGALFMTRDGGHTWSPVSFGGG